jgi:hypothetical protein
MGCCEERNALSKSKWARRERTQCDCMASASMTSLSKQERARTLLTQQRLIVFCLEAAQITLNLLEIGVYEASEAVCLLESLSCCI